MRLRIPLPSLVHGMSQLNAAERQPVHALQCINTWPTVEHGDQKRPPTIHVAKIYNSSFGDAYVHGINRGSGEQYLALFKFGATSASGLVADILGTVVPVFQRNAGGVYSACQYDYLNTSTAYAPPAYIRAMTVQDYTFVVNRNRAVDMANTLTSSNTAGLAHVFVRQGLYAMRYTVKLKIGATTYTVNANTHEVLGINFPLSTSGDGYPVWDYGFPTPSASGARVSVKTEDIAQNLTDKLNGVVSAALGANIVPAGVLTATRVGSVIKVQIQAAATDYVSFEVTTSQGDGLAYGIWKDIDNFGFLPLTFTHGHVVRVKGNSSDTLDDYYVKFVADLGSGFGIGVWEETIKTGIAYKWKTFTLASHPHALIRRTDDSGGTVTGTPNAKFFSWEPLGMEDRAVGDVDSNPAPSFVSTTTFYNPNDPNAAFAIARYVDDVTFFQDHLCFTSGENISCSEAAAYFNFFRTTVRSVPDADPIDVSITSDKVTKIHSAIPFAGKLILFSEEAQHQFLGAPTLTPATVEASEVSRYQSTPACRPVAFEDGIYFPVLQGSYSRLKSLTPTPNAESSFTALDLSLHVPEFIEGNIRQIAVTTDSAITAVLSDGALDTVYVLKQHREGSQILQSAWVKFVIEGATIRGMEFFDTKLYLVLERTGMSVPVTYLTASAGAKYNVALRSNGTAISWGRNTPGEPPQVPVPDFGALTPVAVVSSMGNISLTSGHSLAVMSNGTIVGWGYNNAGQCNAPAPGAGLTFTAAAGGRSFSLGLRNNGTVAGWGDNTFGQLTIASPPVGMTYTSVSCGLYHSVLRRSDGNVITTGGYTVPSLPVGMTYTQAVAGGVHCVALRSDGTVVAWGTNADGQCNVPSSFAAAVTAVAAGEKHSMALLANGNIVCWGRNNEGQCNVPALPAGLTYTQMSGGSTHSIARRSNGTCIGWGSNDEGETTIPPLFSRGATPGVFLEYIDLASGVADGTRDYWLHLDRRFSNPSIAVAAGVTTITSPYDLEEGSYMEVVETATLLRHLGTVASLTTFTVAADLTGKDIVCGKKYTSTHAFHKPQVAINEQNGRKLILDSTSSAVALMLRYEETDYFKVVVGSFETEIGSSTQGFSSNPPSGTAFVGVACRLDQNFDVSVQNDSPFPHTLVSGEWLMNATIRSRSL